MAESNDDAAYCRDRVIRFDPDRAAVIAFQPAESRSGLYALHAFNLEVAQLRETVGEPVLASCGCNGGAMRLTRPPQGGSVATPCCSRGRRHPRSRPAGGPLPPPSRCARADLEAAPPADLPAYARDTGGTLAALAGQIVSGRAGSEDIGTAWALVGWLRAAAFFGWTLPEGAGPRAIAEQAAALLAPAGDGYGRALAALTRGYIRKLDRLDYDLSRFARGRAVAAQGMAHCAWEGLKHGEGRPGRILTDAKGRVGTTRCGSRVRRSRQVGAERVFLIASRTLNHESDVVSGIRKGLGIAAAGLVRGHSGACPPRTVIAAAREARAAKADLIVTVGGSSASGVGKMARLALAHGLETVDDMEPFRTVVAPDGTKTKPEFLGPDIGQVAVPTTLSGGEYYHYQGSTDTRIPEKQGYEHPDMIPTSGCSTPGPRCIHLSGCGSRPAFGLWTMP